MTARALHFLLSGTLRSNYLRRLDLTGSVSYTSGELKMPAYAELFNGLGRSSLRSSDTTDAVLTSRVAAVADFGAVLNITDKLRLIDKFRFDNFRLPGLLDSTNTDLYGANLLTTPNVFSMATCPSPYTAATCPQHSTSSGADITTETRNSFFKQDEKTNTVQLQYDATRKVSARFGYRYDRRSIVDSFLDAQVLTYYPTHPLRGSVPPEPP